MFLDDIQFYRLVVLIFSIYSSVAEQNNEMLCFLGCWNNSTSGEIKVFAIKPN